MKTDLNSLLDELRHLTDSNYLKKEINRVAAEVKNFDVKKNLSAKTQRKLAKLEKRFRDLIGQLHEFQRQVDSNLQKLMSKVRSKAKKAPVRATKKRTKATTRKKKSSAKTE